MTKKVTLIWLLMFTLFSVTAVQAQVPYRDFGYNAVFEAGLVQEVNLSQEQDGMAIYLHAIYADENRVVVEYGASVGVDRELPTTADVRLEDADGTLYSRYEGLRDGKGGGDAGGSWMRGLESFRVGEHWDTLDGNFTVTVTMSDTPAVFEVSVPINGAIRVNYDLTTTAGNMTMHLGNVSASESMTVATLCYILPNQQQAWTPRGTIQVIDTTAPMLTQEPHARPNDVGESCFQMFVALPMTFGEIDAPPLSIVVEELVLPRPYTLDNLTELQTRAQEIGVRVEIFDNGSPIGYSYQFYDSHIDFPALVDDILYDHIVGPWTFEALGLP